MESTATLLEREQSGTSMKTDDRGGKYLVFQLGREEFGIRVMKVREIMGIPEARASLAPYMCFAPPYIICKTRLLPKQPTARNALQSPSEVIASETPSYVK